MAEIQVKRVEPMTVLSLSFTGAYEQTQDRLEELMAGTLRAGHPHCQPPMALYYDDPAKVPAENLRAEVCLPIGEAYEPADEGISRKELPGATVACTVYQGPYSLIAQVYEQIFEWTKANGYRHAEGVPTREVFLKLFGEAEDPKDFVTEIQVPVEKA
jgi:effector-binding domain-containing protein